MAIRILGIHHVGIVVQSLDTSADWYVEHLGFERAHGLVFPGAKVVFLTLGDLRLELIEAAGSMRMAPEREERRTNLKLGGINHVAIAVEDLDRTVGELRDEGVEIASPPSDVPGSGGDRFAFIRDNERMLVELFQSAA